jgi:RNA polymerase sigma-70 factor (ECF subfamily)
MTLDIGELEQHRTALTGHCYRILGSILDAEDAVQETMVRAWKNLDRFEGRSSVRTWLYRIATNVCLDALSSRSRRMRPIEEGDPGNAQSEIVHQPRQHWLEPVPDALAVATDSSPYEQTLMRQSIRLAFVAALQHLPPRQRASLLLADVLGWSAAEIAECLETTTAAVNSALQRARATLAARSATLDEPLSDEASDLLDRYVELFHRYDVDGLVALMREDATMSMPPIALWLRGPSSVRDWLLGPGFECKGSHLVPVRANGVQAFAQFRRAPEGFKAWGLIVLETDGRAITAWNSFLDVETLFPRFGLPLALTEDEVAAGVQPA